MAAPDRNLAHAELLRLLRDPAAYPHPVDTIEVIETHISSVLLAGDFAYKIKKPVDLGFADFSTLERRRTFCEEEIRLNRRSAPSLYLDVVPIVPAAGGVRIGGDGHDAIEYAVRMRRFGAEARLDQMARAGTLDAGIVDRLAATIAAFHAECAPAPENSTYGTAASASEWSRRTLRDLRQLADKLALADAGVRLAKLEAWAEAESALRHALFDARRAEGFVRECHGDLHLANVALIDGAPVPFDCIEFNPELRFIDVMSDVAFTWMDLIDHGLETLAARFLNGYLEASGDYAGLQVLRFYAVYRALVRALVALIRRSQVNAADETAADAQAQEERKFTRYLEVAERLVQAAPRLIVAVYGPSGSGKTTVAHHLVESLGAVCVRSDIERKRSAGLAPTARTGSATGLYDAAVTQATYQRLGELAVQIVAAGVTAIVDATYQRRGDRRALAAVAADNDAQIAFVLCTAPPATLHARVTARGTRGDDASDATSAVLTRQLASFDAPDAAEAASTRTIDTDTDFVTLAQRCASLAKSLLADARASRS